MHTPPYKCLFCLKTSGPFLRVEHPIPESLGNDDFSLPPGFVCDPCNQYFGAKIEQRILDAPPFSVERIRGAVKTKKGKLAKLQNNNLLIRSSGIWDRVFFAGAKEPVESILQQGVLYVTPPSDYGNFLARFLLKIGIELLSMSDDVDVFAPEFNAARNCARYGTQVDCWNVGYGLYPNRKDLVVATREDEIGSLETRQVYEYSLGAMPSGDVTFFFSYFTHCFSCNLSAPALDEYLFMFNQINEFSMHGRL